MKGGLSMPTINKPENEIKLDKHIGTKLRNRRVQLKLTQTKVGNALKVSFQQIQKYEKGINGVSAFRILQLSNHLKVPISYFFEEFDPIAFESKMTYEGNYPEINKCNQVRNEKLYPNPNSCGELPNHLDNVLNQTLKIGR